jgi:alkylhydroperoxidase/carboxymuconolactone decarboxylase family protein YurZ
MASDDKMKRALPSRAGRLADRHSKVWAAYEQLGEAVGQAGPLDAKARRLVKLAIAIGCSSEQAVHSRVRRAVLRRCETGRTAACDASRHCDFRATRRGEGINLDG